MDRGREGWKAKERIIHAANQRVCIGNEGERLEMHENRMGGLVGVVHGIDYLYLSLAVVLMPGKLEAEGDREGEKRSQRKEK